MAKRAAPDKDMAAGTHANMHLRAWRLFRGMTQATAAARVRVKPQTLSKWERGTLPPRTDDMEALAEVYRTSVTALMGPPQQPDFLVTHERVARILGRLDADGLEHWLAVGEAMARGR